MNFDARKLSRGAVFHTPRENTYPASLPCGTAQNSRERPGAVPSRHDGRPPGHLDNAF